MTTYVDEAASPKSSALFVGGQLNLFTEFRELLEEVRALASHGQPKGELLPLMKRALQVYRSELRKTRFGVGRKPRRASSARNSVPQGETPARNIDAGPANAVKRSRHVPANVAREIYRRDDGCCTFVSEDGRRCAAGQFLEIDHVQPWAEGRLETVENLRLRCPAHNLRSARQHFGDEQVRDAVARGRGKTGAPAGGQW